MGLYALAVACLAGGLLVTVLAGRESRRLITTSFNDQQLLIARHARDLIERAIGRMHHEMDLVAGRISEGDGGDPEDHLSFLRDSLARVHDIGVVRIALVDLPSGTTRVLNPYRDRLEEIPLNRLGLELPASLDREHIWTSPTGHRVPEVSFVMARALDAAGERILVFEINVSWFLTPFLKGIRSGRTGYAWLIDEEGTFLYHPDATFVGQTAFDARRLKYPGVSFVRIDSIQKNRMLKGEEGTGSYVSAWHRGITGEMEKLIAFTPIEVSDLPVRVWSVAVAAPLAEIEDEIRASYRWQVTIQGIGLLIVALAVVTVVTSARRNRRTLEDRVTRRTAELQRSEERYRSLVESSEDYILTLDADLRIDSVNTYAARFFGESRERLAGRSLADLLPPGDPSRPLRLVRRVFSRGRSMRAEFELARDNHRILVDVSCVPLRDEGGTVAKALCVARDVTEQRKLERSLISTEKLAALGTLAAGFAHEINNPLGVILGFCDLLLKRSDEGSQAWEDLKVIQRQGLHCKDIVENLLSISRTDREEIDHADLGECVEDVARVVRHNLEMRRIALTLEIEPDIRFVRGAPRHLGQVFLNLVNNAMDAMPDGGTLTIRARFESRRNRAVAEFVDDGHGVPPEKMKHIFEPFYTTKPAGEGTGLGLFVSYGIVTRYGGCIEASSRPATEVRRGRTAFAVILPRHAE